MPFPTLFLFLSLQQTATASTPRHLRAVEAPPEAWADLFAPTRPVRLFWNGEARFGVEVEERGAWRLLTEEAAPGWTSPPLPRGTRLRTVSPDGEVGTPVQAWTVSTPADLARLSAKQPALVGSQVVDIETDASGAPWNASLGGGLARLDPATLAPVTLTTRDGLPSDWVVAVAPAPDGLWAGTAAGLARVEPGPVPGSWRVSEVVDDHDGLPSRYVQALLADGPSLWVGTFQGLARRDRGSISTLLGPWSVFSLLRGTDGRVWAGYEGLLGLPEADPIEGVPDTIDVYDVEPLPSNGALLATLQEGLVLLEDGRRRTLWTGNDQDGAYAVARAGDAWLVAGAGAGLVTVSPEGGVLRRWTAADGLPSEVVNEVVPDRAWNPASPQEPAQSVWIGTARGVARLDPTTGSVQVAPLAPLHAGNAWQRMAPAGRRIVVMGDDGLAFAGPRRLLDGPRTRRVAPGLLDRTRTGGSAWEVREAGVLQHRIFKRDRLHHLPGRPVGIVTAAGVPFVGTDQGLFRYEAERGRFAPVAGLRSVTRMVPEADGTIWLISEGRVASLGPDLSIRYYLRTRPPLDLDPDRGVVWVGTEDGMDVVAKDSGEVVELLRTLQTRVRAEAVAADGFGGCWVATDVGQVLHLDIGQTSTATLVDLADGEPPKVRDLLPRGRDGAWVLTDQGLFAVAVPAQR
ncbi:MAG: hypothetical protein JXB39_13160 [Deltaproteobacteria bacterium]|nr:hypothetical protein [Deltaproteobacteria bacterium]